MYISQKGLLRHSPEVIYSQSIFSKVIKSYVFVTFVRWHHVTNVTDYGCQNTRHFKTNNIETDSKLLKYGNKNKISKFLCECQKVWKVHLFLQQESPPAWTQEAYHLPCSEYSFCCPILAAPPPQLTPPSWLTPRPTDPPADCPPQLSQVTDPPPAESADWGPPPGWVGWVTPPQVWTDKQSETITFPSYYVRGR